VADYKNGNKRFFDATKLFVVEVDQRGTGNSQPSIRDDAANMKYYTDVSIDLIANDYEAVRQHLGIGSWVVWGGSYGSTIALNYCMRYPESCVALLLRGIYLDTEKELAEVYSRRAFEDDERKLEQFDMLYDLAREEVEKSTRAEDSKPQPLDPNDDRRLLEVYEQMILRGYKRAMWMWHVFENNLMEDDPELQIDPNHIMEEKFPEAQSLAFFETRLWLHGTFEAPSNLLERVNRLDQIPIWICQGIYDNVCPVQNAWNLVRALKGVHHRHPRSHDPGFLQAYFLDANHEDTDPVMERCLKKIMNEFFEMYADG
jgi:proline iminopeptidase